MKIVTVKIKEIKVPESLEEYLSLTPKEKMEANAYEKSLWKGGDKIEGGGRDGAI